MQWKKTKEYLLASQTDPERRLKVRKLQAIILISAAVMALLNLIRFYDFIINPRNGGLPLPVTLIIFLLFVSLWYLIRKGKDSLGAWLLIVAYSLPTIFCFYQWGADLPAAIMMTVLIVLLAGIFLGPKQALSISLIFTFIILALSYLQFHGIVSVDQGWRQKPNEPADALSYILIFSIIFLLAWLISRENHRSLAKLKAVGQELQQERDQLETKVQERTQTIRLMQREKLEQLQALASIGQLSGGVFHDIVNPLTVVSLNLEEMQREKADSLEQSQTYVQQALKATERISDLIKSVNDRLRRQNQEEYFSLRLEIEEIKKIMESKSKYQQITISFPDGKDAKIKGVRARFGQIIMNILANAIDALLNNNTKIKNINISLTINEEKKIISISIQDNGPGISPDNLPHIFEQFFSTKQADGRNLGLGLSVVKEIVTKDFQGQIKVKSSLEEGSLFTIILPLTS